MSRENLRQQINSSLFSLWHYLEFFCLISFVVSCSLLLFLGDMDVPAEVVRISAPKTFANVILLSAICCGLDGIRRKFTVERPVKRILDATYQWTQGNFTARITPLHSLDSRNEFDVIIANFNQMADELAGTELLRTDFIANVSHELKTPLAVIENYATMLQDATLSEEKRASYAQAIAAASCRLADLITNILKLNKLETQQIFPEAQMYDLSEQLCACLLLFEHSWEKKALVIETALDEEVIIKADAELLTLVWNNLFSNAIKFTDPGGQVSVSLQRVAGEAVVKVTDTGCGISPEIGQHIFEKFYQGDSSHATQGNGLGLALVKRVMDIVGGDIYVESVPGKGSTFIVTLK